MPQESAAKFFSCNPEKGVASRFGSGGSGRANQFIGAHRDPEDQSRIVFDPSAVIAIPMAEYARFRKEYDRLIKDGALKVRSAADYAASRKPAPVPVKDEKPKAAKAESKESVR